MLLNFLTSRSGTDPCARFLNARADSSNNRSLPNVELFADKSLVSACIPPALQKDSLVSGEQTVWETAAQAWIRVDQDIHMEGKSAKKHVGMEQQRRQKKALGPPSLFTFSSML